MLNSQYVNQIKKLNPLSESIFLYESKKWKDVPFITQVTEFEDKEISRQDCIDAFSVAFKSKDNHLKPFLLTMIWGYANAGYGPYRITKMLQHEGNIALLTEGIQLLAQPDNLEMAFHKLDQVKGLGISFFSKILYFASRANDYPQYALIFDIQVARSLVWLTSTNEIYDIVEIQPISSWKAYHKYIALIHKQAEIHSAHADAIEMFLFEGKFKE